MTQPKNAQRRTLSLIIQYMNIFHTAIFYSHFKCRIYEKRVERVGRIAHAVTHINDCKDDQDNAGSPAGTHTHTRTHIYDRGTR